MRIKFTNIEYDTDGVDVKLPTELELDVPEGFDHYYDGADAISDHTGWCVLGFTVEKTDKEADNA